MTEKKNENGMGKVWLVGAGPSDIGLFTLKGKKVLEQAEVVVYDALAGQAVLNLIPDTAEAINVGKRSSNHIMRQEQINELLVEKAKQGKRVVRLKGGDPFLFGRGGEEIELLVKHRVPFEVVPGVTSAIAVPAYQGIPVTHRDFCSSVHIITGHKRAGETYDIDFDALVRTKGTLVFLMGVASLPDICRGLLDNGMDPKKPAALLMHGTTAGQDRIVSTVSELPKEVERRGAKTPAIIVVGEVCGLADEFCWYEKMPLGGVKVLITRPKELVSETAERLRTLGAEVLEMPAIRTVKRTDNQALYEALSDIGQYQWIVFTSPAGVRIFFETMEEKKMDVRSLYRAKVAVIGSGTAKELKKHGLYADFIPSVYDAEHLGGELRKLCKGDEKILIPRAAIGSRELNRGLEGLCVTDIPTYDTVYEKGRIVDERAGIEDGTIDYVLFTSASTVRGFTESLKDIDYGKVKAVCIGKQTKAAADAFGMQTCMSEKATIDSLIEKLVEVAEKERNQ